MPALIPFIALTATDMERTKAFFQAIGLHFRSEQHGNGPRHYSAKCGETVLEIYPAKQDAPACTQGLVLGLHVPDIEPVLERLKAIDPAYVKRCYTMHGRTRANLTTPDGCLVLITDKP